MTREIIKISDRPELKNIAAKWFHQKWDIPEDAYQESIEDALSLDNDMPQWYLALDKDRIIGGCGIIDNDFHDRKDLSPNLCALFVEPGYRGRGIAGELLDFACRDMKTKGVDILYLITDQTSFYERYGWHYLCDVNCENENRTIRMYCHSADGVILETERLLLRPWRDSDAESLYEFASDDRVGPAAGWPVHENVEFSLEIIRTVFSQRGVYAVTFKGEDKAVGMIGLIRGAASNFDIPEDEAEISYWIGVPYWGQGLIPEAMHELIRYGFETLKLKRLWCGYFDGNEKSKRAQEKCGFHHHHTEPLRHFPLIDVYRVEHVSCLRHDDLGGSHILGN